MCEAQGRGICSKIMKMMNPSLKNFLGRSFVLQTIEKIIWESEGKKGEKSGRAPLVVSLSKTLEAFAF